MEGSHRSAVRGRGVPGAATHGPAVRGRDKAGSGCRALASCRRGEGSAAPTRPPAPEGRGARLEGAACLTPVAWPSARGRFGCVDESGCRPGSVPCRRLRRPGDGHPSRVAVADHLQRPTRVLGRAALDRTLSGLAPDGVYRADLVTQVAGGLLHHRFTLAPTTCVVGAVCSLWHCPAGRPGWLLATILPFGARTFLGGGCPPTRPSARLVRRQCRGSLTRG